MTPHSSTLAWKIPWTEEPGRLQSMGSLIVGHDWVTSLSLFTFMHWRRKWQPTPVFLPGESQERGACWAAIYGVTQSRTQLEWLSSSSSNSTCKYSWSRLVLKYGLRHHKSLFTKWVGTSSQFGSHSSGPTHCQPGFSWDGNLPLLLCNWVHVSD